MRMKWVCPIYGGGRVVWCGACLRLRVGVSSCAGGGVVGSAEGREEVVTHQLTAQTAHVHSTGGACDKQVLNVLHGRTHAPAHTYTHAHGHTHIHTRRLLTTHCHPNVHMCTHRHTHTSISTHDKVMQITFAHRGCTNVIFSLTSIIGLLNGHSGQWSSCWNCRSASAPDSTESCPPIDPGISTRAHEYK